MLDLATLEYGEQTKLRLDAVGASRKAETAADKVAVSIARRDLRREVPGASGYVVYALAEGAAYGLNAATGQVLWRRFVGYSPNGSKLGFAPLRHAGLIM